MLDEDLAPIRAPRNNTNPYRRLLRTKVSEWDPHFIKRRLAEEQPALDALTADTFPVAFAMPKGSAGSEGAGAEP